MRRNGVNGQRSMGNGSGLPEAADLGSFAASLGFVACGVASLEPSRYGAALDGGHPAGDEAERRREGPEVGGLGKAVPVAH